MRVLLFMLVVWFITGWLLWSGIYQGLIRKRVRGRTGVLVGDEARKVGLIYTFFGVISLSGAVAGSIAAALGRVH